MLFPVVNLPPFPNRFRVFPFLRRFLSVEPKIPFVYLNDKWFLNDGSFIPHGVLEICSGDHVCDNFSSM